MQTQTLEITPQVIAHLDYTGLCALSDAVKIVDPRKVNITGTITLDDLGNVISVDAKVVGDVEPDFDEWEYKSEKRHIDAGIL